MAIQEKLLFKKIDNVLIGEEVLCENDINIGELILNSLKSQPNFVAQVDATTGREITFQEIRNKSVKLAIWMKSSGVCPGDAIVISSNHYAVLYVFLASLYIGAIPTLWHEKHKFERIQEFMKNGHQKILFINDIMAIALYDYIVGMKCVPKVIIFGTFTAFMSYDTLKSYVNLKYSQEAVDDFICAQLDENRKNIAVVLYTRNVSSFYKAIKIPHTAFIASVNQQVFDMFPGNVGMWVGSFSLRINMMLAVHSLLSTKRMIRFMGYRKEEICQALEKHKVNWTLLETYVCKEMVNSNVLGRYDLSSLKMLIFSGSPISYDDQSSLITLLPNISVVSLYCTCETGIIACPIKNGKIKSSGYVGKNVSLKIMCINGSNILGPNMSGKIWCKCEGLAYEFYDLDYGHCSRIFVIDKHGWHFTGDIGYYDEDGEIFITERSDNLISFNNLKFSPLIIENVISRHTSVDAVAVVLIPSKKQDVYHPIAYIVTKRRKKLNTQEIIDEVAKKLDDNMKLRGGVRLLLEMPYALDGCIDRLKLRLHAFDIYWYNRRTNPEVVQS